MTQNLYDNNFIPDAVLLIIINPHLIKLQYVKSKNKKEKNLIIIIIIVYKGIY